MVHCSLVIIFYSGEANSKNTTQNSASERGDKLAAKLLHSGDPVDEQTLSPKQQLHLLSKEYQQLKHWSSHKEAHKGDQKPSPTSLSAGGLHLPKIAEFRPLRSASQILAERQKAVQMAGVGAPPKSKKESIQEEEQAVRDRIKALEKQAGQAELGE